MNYLCETCSHNLLEYGHPCYQMFRKILKLHVNDHMMTYDEKEVLHMPVKCIINFMEKKELVVTTEINENLIVAKLNTKNIHFHHDVNTFCFKKNKDHFHKNELFKVHKKSR